MIYKHYKGGLYFMVGYVTQFMPSDNLQVELFKTATHTETEEVLTVLLVKDKATGGSHYAVDSDKYNGILCFYEDIDGNYWLRPKEMFFGTVMTSRPEFRQVIKVPRFEKVTGKELFDAISDLIDREVGAIAEHLNNLIEES
ncbi:DUF1653 family protein [Bacillus phage vB_BanS-Thrax1]|nr:DUF1653 family protein [Bacillus phage vB_BanS-Thrax1]